MTALLPLCLLVAVEYSNPQQGVLATLIPRLKEEQRRWLESAEDESKSGGIETGVAKERAVGERGVAEGASSPPDPALSQLTPQQEPGVPDKAAQKSSGQSAFATTEKLTPEQEGSRPASTLPKDRSKGANGPPTSADSASSDRPSSTQSADRASPSEAIVAEGVGTTPDEALKDAFRNAVRQVVGAVVDAETLIKNDEVINDKVLTYSDGFIKKFDEVPGSKKTERGLHRTKIIAMVERRRVVATLKATNVTVKEIDGRSMFAEVVTQLDAEKDTASLLKKQFEGFPQTLLTASAIGRPELVEKATDKASVRIHVRLEPDLEAYKTFVARLQPMLDKLAKDKGEFTAVFSLEWPYDKSFVYFAPKEPGFIEDIMAGWMPKSFSGGGHYTAHTKSEYTTVALTTQRSKAADRLECRYYLMDKSLQPLLADVGSRKGSGKLSLLDADGNVIVVDRFSLSERVPWNPQTYEGTLIAPAGNSGFGFYMFDTQYEPVYCKKQHALFFWISPVFILPRTNSINYKPSLQVTRTVSLSLDELKSVKDARVEITFDQ